MKNNSSVKCNRFRGFMNATEFGSKIKSTFKREGSSFVQEEGFDPSKLFHPGPLKLEIKSIRNSTRSDYQVDMNSLMANEESGRSLITAAILVTWIFIWKIKAYVSFFIVHTIDFIWTSIKNVLGWGNDHYETTITFGGHRPHGHKAHRHGLYDLIHGRFGRHPHGHPHQHHSHSLPHQHGHGHQHHHHGWGHRHKWVYKMSDPWYHPATKLFEQATYQYLPDGKDYSLYGYDQTQAYKYQRKYKKKYDKYRRKYYRKKGKGIIKAQRQRDKEKRKAERRKKKAARRKEKWERFKERVKEVKDFYDKLQSGDHDDDDDEHHHDDLDHLREKQEERGETTEEEEELPDKHKSKENDDEEENDDLAYDDKSWEETSSEIEHGPPPPISSPSSYHQGQDYDPLPTKSKNQKYIRIRL